MKLAILALFLTTSAFATEASLIRSSVVKIVSKLQGSGTEFRGSGLLFSKDGKRYVLTSDHVVGHADSFITHLATSPISGENLVLKFLAADWGNGLALMRVDGDRNPQNAVPYSELTAVSTPKVGASAGFYGYPFESTSLTEETFATLLDLEAPMPYFVLARKLVELEAAVGEFGMSGGPVFSEENEFMGVLAYQRLLEESRENRVYAIPRPVVVAWLDHYFKTAPKYMPVFSEPWFAQGDAKQLLLTNDGLLFMFRIQDGRFRAGIGRVEHLMILTDGPTVPYVDKRGFMKVFKQLMKDYPLQPSEFGIVDRASGKPVLKKILFPSETFNSFDEAKTSIFLILGEKHETRYARVRPAVDALARLAKPVQGEIGSSLAAFIKRFADMPPHPQDPSTPGANEYYNINWTTDVVFHAEAIQTLPGWKEMDAKVREALKATIDSLQSFELTPP